MSTEMAASGHKPAFDRDSASAFCNDLSATVDTLIRVLEEETRLVREVRLTEAAAIGEEKAALADRYVRAHGVLKSNNRDISRFAAVEIDHLRRRHGALEGAIAANLAVLATARTVSETLIRSVAEAVSRSDRPADTYSADARRNDGGGSGAAPVSLNVAL